MGGVPCSIFPAGGCYTDRMSRFEITSQPLSSDGLTLEVAREARQRGEGCGAVASFVGVVRATHRGRRVRFLTYEAYPELALHVFERIDAEITREWTHAIAAIRHRVGRLDIGEASVVIAAATAHRAEAFQVCRYAIERVKQIAPIWKHEVFEDGEAWVEGALADPDDETARQEARARACA
jgi:molybdopterin synthase catalytic subunit